MLVYRVSKAKYANDMMGEGARLHGGRWNHKDMPCIYTSESRALALLEYSVNVNVDEIPRALSIVTFEIPDTKIKHVKIADLPGNWKDAPAPISTKNFGSDLLKAALHFAIKIPSSVIPNEFNFLLNPRHTNAKLNKIIDVEDLIFDIRIKGKDQA